MAGHFLWPEHVGMGAWGHEDTGRGQLLNVQAKELVSDDQVYVWPHSSWQQCEQIGEENWNQEIIMKAMQWSSLKKSLIKWPIS